MLGENIMRLRKRQGMSQQALADELHVVRQTISKWEKDLSVPDAEALTRLADALDTTVQELLGMPQEGDAAPSDDIAEALAQINVQLAIQNRRRSRVWKAAVWVLALIVAIDLLALMLGWTHTADVRLDPAEVVVVEQSEDAAPEQE